jgi:hypothetical protein
MPMQMLSFLVRQLILEHHIDQVPSLVRKQFVAVTICHMMHPAHI